MPGSVLGTEVRRVEDPELLRGEATYVDNLPIPGAAHVAFVRSPFAHAEITGIDKTEAEQADGVLAVYTAADLDLPPVRQLMVVNSDCVRTPLATDRVRFVGDAVAAVVAETRAAAADAVELVDVDYEPLPVVADPEEALADDAPLQFPELGTNIAAGERDQVGAEILADADVVARARIENQRVAVVPMEGNAIAVEPGGGYLGGDYDLTIHVSTQMPHALWQVAAKQLRVDADRIHLVTPHVGGAFGGKVGMIAEHQVVVAAVQRLGRPVKWVETRSENMQAMPQSRAQVQYAELGLKSDGTITGLHCDVLGDCGAYAGFGGGFALGPTRLMSQGVYRIPKISFGAIAVLTNTTPTGAFRGAGRPEAAAMLERIIDVGAAELGMDPVELRRKNFLQPDQFPYRTLVGAKYDSGDYDLPLREALQIADYDELRKEQRQRIDAGETTLLGVGVSTYVEITGGGGDGEFAEVEMSDEGRATIKVGTSGHGQGHPTSFSMLASDALGIPLERIDFVQSDTAQVPRGGGTGGSRSLQIGGSAVREASERLVAKAKELAATKLEAAVEDIEVTGDGDLGVLGVPSARIGWAELAAYAAESGSRLAADTDFTPGGATFPFGAHVSVVEVDTETGKVTPIRHIAVDDCGRVLNPLLVRGQQHGGAVQGISQALWEHYTYDEDGNPSTGTLADYLVPSAMEVPMLEASNTETDSPLNPLGAKGIGESATIGATPAVQNAVVDAVRHLGVRHIDMPLTPQRVWQAIREAQDGRPADPWRDPPAAFATVPVRDAGSNPHADEAAV
ncbi:MULTISPECIES: xanthine dehydrogenase family protein molybdopterin-binding subunit [Prauserella salsuginis group]|uniref:Carbon-monoxide dehydrogenase large subunit n=2 Tax=Prauserella salsuginis group TaxID=2893672 RepID=A0A839XPL5_9PSEU|nr:MULTISPECIES: xanthine dehydrogenase family protein molybdopterin-binding subunit [Prauserella salsuginis group]MBB3663434.1 carbon-monoxide dehydrogenase large subunit [Prauserella sediminis]MCR3720746.1 carbon-monoxide dehydrogenase large subunit [Prauserella flava]MCR3735173.1 carbon-monoxide dehydrogenase large subunit [Prauserella salsuginis]